MDKPAAPRLAGEGHREPSVIYKVVMTPLIFVTFLISLSLVDLRHIQLRSRSHAGAGAQAGGPSSSPAAEPPGLMSWLRPSRWLPMYPMYLQGYQPYQYARVDENGRPIGDRTATGDSRWYYHRKQHRLIKMHIHDAVENIHDALETRSSVLAVMALLGLLVLVGVWKGMGWILRKGGVI